MQARTMMVEKGCERCREWQEHYYRKHMDVSKMSFFKLMTGDFAKGISIPEKFVRNFKITEEAVDLKVTSGETWRIILEKRDNELYLMSGWMDFSKAQELRENDLLVFTCSNERSSFDVQVFEESGCVKTPSLFGLNMCRHFSETAGRRVEHYSLSDSDDTTMPSQLVGCPRDACISKKRGREPDSQNSSSCHVKHEAVEEGESDDMHADSKYYYSRFANQLTNDEKEEVLGLAPIGRDNPVFVTVLQKSHCQRRNNSMTIPSGLAADHLEARSQDIILRRPNRKESWTVRYYYTSSHRCIQNLQFFNFVRENKLREGDVCLFELVKGARRATMSVHVVRRKVQGRFALVG